MVSLSVLYFYVANKFFVVDKKYTCFKYELKLLSEIDSIQICSNYKCAKIVKTVNTIQRENWDNNRKEARYGSFHWILSTNLKQ